MRVRARHRGYVIGAFDGYSSTSLLIRNAASRPYENSRDTLTPLSSRSSSQQPFLVTSGSGLGYPP